MIIYDKKDRYLVIPLGLGNLNGVYEVGYNEGKEDGLTEGYNNGFEAGKNDYISKLQDLTVTRNGIYSNFFTGGSKIGYNTVVVEVPLIVQGGNKWFDGSVDVAGLKAIGWDDEDISMLQDNIYFYSWANDDWLVSHDNRQLYGVMTAENHGDYADRAIFCPKFDTSSVTNMSRYFGELHKTFSKTKGFPKFDTSNVTNMSYMFNGCSSLISIPAFNTSKVTHMGTMFNDCSSLISIPALNTSNVTNMSYMFRDCINLTTIPLLDTSNVTTINGMFKGCTKLTSLPSLDTSKATIMNSMFEGCSVLTTIPTLNTVNVTSMINMFNSCSSLTTIPTLNTSKVEHMNGMFRDCSSLTTIPLLNTSNVTNMFTMFSGCSSLTTIPALDTSKVTNMSNMFSNCTSLTSLPEFDASNVTSMSNYFGWSEMTNLRNVRGWRNLKCSWDDGFGLNQCPNIDPSDMKAVLDYLYDFTGNGETPNSSQGRLAIHKNHFENPDLQPNIERAVAKGWTIVR